MFHVEGFLLSKLPIRSFLGGVHRGVALLLFSLIDRQKLGVGGSPCGVSLVLLGQVCRGPELGKAVIGVAQAGERLVRITAGVAIARAAVSGQSGASDRIMQAG